MKKLLFLSVIVTGLLSFTPIVKNNLNQKQKIMSFTKSKNNLDCRYGQCQATAKSTGRQCQHCVSNEGDWYCWQHK